METEDLLQRIERKPGVPGGKPVIKGTRLSVEHILSVLGSGESETELLEEYPGLTVEDIQVCLRFVNLHEWAMSRQGFKLLFAALIDRATGELEHTAPDVVRDVRSRIRPDDHDEDRFVRACRAFIRANRLQLNSKTRRSLEASLSFFESAWKIDVLRKLTFAIPETSGAPHSDFDVILLDQWTMSLDRHLDALQRLAASVESSNESELVRAVTSVVGESINKWKADIAKSRNVSVHGNTTFIRGIDEDGLWEPLLILGMIHADGLPLTMEIAAMSDGRIVGQFAERGGTADRLLMRTDAFCQLLAQAL